METGKMIRDILLIQKREIERTLKEKYIKREAVLKKINNDLIKVIMGPRRAGKSFFAVHMLNGSGTKRDKNKIIFLSDLWWVS